MMKRKIMLAALAVCMLAGFASAAPTHETVTGSTAGGITDETSVFVANGEPSSTDLLEGATGVLDPLPAGSGPVLLGSDASYLVDGFMFGENGNSSSTRNGFFLCNSCGDGTGTVTYTGLGGVDIGKISIYHGNSWDGDMDLEVYVDTGSGFSLLYATGFIDAPRGEYRLDIFDDTSLAVPLATGVVGLKFVVDASAATDFVYTWEIDALPVPLVVVEPTAVEITEGGVEATVTVTVTQEPNAVVTITALPSGDNALDYYLNGADPNTSVDLVFTPSDWAPKTLTITAVNDLKVEVVKQDLVTMSVSTSIPSYVGLVLPDITVDIIDNDTAATHETVPGLINTWVNDARSRFVPILQPSRIDLLEGSTTGVLDPLAGVGACRPNSDADKLVDGFLFGDGGTSSSETNGWFLRNNGSGTVTWTGLGGVDIGKISIYHGNSWNGDINATVYVDTGSGFELLYGTGFIDNPRGEYRLDIFSADGFYAAPLVEGVVGLRIAVDTVGASDFVYMWEIDAMPVPVIKATETSGSTMVGENGATDTIEFMLLEEPAADVSMNFTVDAAQLTVTPNPLVLTKADWETPKSVTVGAVDDAALESDPHSSVLTWVSDPNDLLRGGTYVEIAENECGAWGYDAIDLALFLNRWMVCTKPGEVDCVDMR